MQRGSARQAHWLAVNQQLAPVAADDLTLEWVQRKYRLGADAAGRPDLQVRLAAEGDRARHAARCGSRRAARNFPLPTQEPGDFVLVLRDAAGAELNKLSYSVAGEANLSRSLDRNAELQVQLDKPAYAGGDTIEVSIRAPYVGRGPDHHRARPRLSSISGSRPTTTSSVQQIQLPRGFRRQRLRQRAVRARSVVGRNLPEPAVVRRGAVLREPGGAHRAADAQRARARSSRARRWSCG